MARKRHSDEDCLKLVREIELHLSGGMELPTACRTVGISDATYDNWRKRFGSKDQPAEIEGGWGNFESASAIGHLADVALGHRLQTNK